MEAHTVLPNRGGGAISLCNLATELYTTRPMIYLLVASCNYFNSDDCLPTCASSCLLSVENCVLRDNFVLAFCNNFYGALGCGTKTAKHELSKVGNSLTDAVTTLLFEWIVPMMMAD